MPRIIFLYMCEEAYRARLPRIPTSVFSMPASVSQKLEDVFDIPPDREVEIPIDSMQTQRQYLRHRIV